VSDPVKVPEDLQDRVKTIKGLLQLGVYATERLSSLETEMNYIERIAALTEQSENRHQRALSLARKDRCAHGAGARTGRSVAHTCW
jgi:signal recognition particle GTPase